MTTKHTPGPWERRGPWATDQGGHILTIAAKNFPRDIAMVALPLNHEEAKANARLIAAAPELLEALEAMLSVQSQRRHPLGLPSEGIAYAAAEAASKARAAIAKAKGE